MPPSVFPTGVTINLPKKSHDTLVIYDSGHRASALIDMNGNEVHSWAEVGHPAEIVDPALTGGELGHVFGGRASRPIYNDTVMELDWDGKVVWEWSNKAPGGKAGQHHDMARLANGNWMILSHVEQTIPGLFDDPVTCDILYEVSAAGDVAWSYNSGNHLAEFGYSGENAELLTRRDLRGSIRTLMAFNTMQAVGDNKWFRDGDARFDPENIIIGSRSNSYVAIIDRQTDAIVWRLGPDLPGSYDMSKRAFSGPLPRPVDAMGGQHDAHLIADGLPGAGNMLLFDNQGSAGVPPQYMNGTTGSRILEIDPISQEIVWQYDATMADRPSACFYSSHGSSARRLANGNTLVCESTWGRIFQVTTAGEVVWEFINPGFNERDPATSRNAENITNTVYRAQPVPYDWVPEDTPHTNEPVIPAGMPTR